MLSNELPKHIRADEIRVRQVLYNLLGNAFKFTEKGEVSLAVTMSEEGHKIIFDVNDTGIGIPSEQQEIIFEAFRQQDGHITRKYGGTGLGLTISRRLTNLMGGSLVVKSEKDKGSTFTVTIPYHPVQTPDYRAAETDDSKPYESERKNRKVIIAEDNDSNRLLLSELIIALDKSIQIIEVKNGEEALEAAIKYKPDLIFMDLMMPLMDGYKANRKIKEDSQLASIPVIAWTAAVMKEDEKKIRNEFQAMLRKPSSMTEVKMLLANYLK